MEKEVLKKIKKNKKWYNKIVISIFGSLFYNTYREGMVECFKYYNK